MNAVCGLHTHTTASDGQYTPAELMKPVGSREALADLLFLGEVTAMKWSLAPPDWEKVLLEVKTVDVFSYRLAMSWKNRFAPWMSMGR